MTSASPPPVAIAQGDLFWVARDDERTRAEGVAHPYLVLQDDVFNRSRLARVIVCALTSNLRRATEPGNVLLDAGEGGLPKRSVVVVSQLESLDKRELGERIGRLAAARVEEALAGLRFQQRAFDRR